MPAHRPSTGDSDRNAIERLYERYRAALRQFFMLQGRRQEADDLTQGMFLELVRSPPPQDLQDAQGYLFKVAWNALHALSRRERTDPMHSTTATLTSRSSNPLNTLWLEDDSSALLAQETFSRILSQLPRAVQVAVLRHYRDGRSYRQIADELGCTAHTVKKYISRALHDFRAQLTEDGKEI